MCLVSFCFKEEEKKLGSWRLEKEGYWAQGGKYQWLEGERQVFWNSCGASGEISRKGCAVADWSLEHMEVSSLSFRWT